MRLVKFYDCRAFFADVFQNCGVKLVLTSLSTRFKFLEDWHSTYSVLLNWRRLASNRSLLRGTFNSHVFVQRRFHRLGYFYIISLVREISVSDDIHIKPKKTENEKWNGDKVFSDLNKFWCPYSYLRLFVFHHSNLPLTQNQFSHNTMRLIYKLWHVTCIAWVSSSQCSKCFLFIKSWTPYG